MAAATTTTTTTMTGSPAKEQPQHHCCERTTTAGGGHRPPNRPAHERMMESIAQRQSEREERRRFLQDRLRHLREQQNLNRQEKDSIGEERTKTDERLTAVNKEVDAKRDQVQKLRAGLPSTNEDHIQDQIRNLEYQLRKHNFKPPEEKKIIIEIDRLNRSKKLLKDHNVLKVELDRLRMTQRQFREQRDRLFRQRGDLNKREGILKRDTKEIREELDKIKAELDELNAERRKAVTEFKTLESEHKKFLYERREEQRLKRKEEREAAEAEKKKELEEIKANAEPFDGELKLIANLISYCLRFEFPSANVSSNSSPGGVTPAAPATASNTLVVNNGFLAVPGANLPLRRGSHESGLRQKEVPGSCNTSTYATPIGATPVSTPVETGCFIYKKDDTDETLFAGVSKKTSRKNSRNERRNSRAKLLNHNPEIYSQFGQFGLKPPSSTKEVLSVIDGLKEKQQYYENLASEEKSARLNGKEPKKGNLTNEGANSEKASKKPPPPSQLDVKRDYPPAPSVQITDLDEEEATPFSNASEEAFPSLPESKKTSNGGGCFFESSNSEEGDNVNGVNNGGGKNKEYSGDEISSLTVSLKKDLKMSQAASNSIAQDL